MSKESGSTKRLRDFKNAYKATASVILVDYENAEVFARTILDAASEIEYAHDIVRPHIFCVLRRDGLVEVSHKNTYTTCKVSMSMFIRPDSQKTQGSVKIFDPNREVFAVLSQEIDYSKSLFEDFMNKNAKAKL